MQSQIVFYVDMQGKGKGPLPLHSIPKTNINSKTKSNNKTKTKNKIKVVYTEDLTHRDDDAWEIVFEMGALSHGLIMLYLGGRIDMPPARFRAFYRRCFRRYIHGIRK